LAGLDWAAHGRGQSKVIAAIKARQKGPLSVRELRVELAQLGKLALDMRESRKLASQTPHQP
jgi:hypothetical protein